MLGVAAHRLGDLRLALVAKRRAATLMPHDVAIQTNLANTLRRTGHLQEAERVLRRVITVPAAPAAAHNMLALVLQSLGRTDEACAAFGAAMNSDPSFVQAHSNLLFLLAHEGGLSPADLLSAHQEFDRRHGMPLKARGRPHDNLPDPTKRLRVGFVSGDLRRHAVARFLLPIWKAIDPRFVDIVAYPTHPQDDEVTQQLRSLCTAWIPAWSLGDDALAARIRADRIDILIDLSGHTAHNRLLVFARKPAPVQVSALGYPGTTGLSSMDYTITDRFRTPRELSTQFVEKVVWIPTACTFAHDAAADPAPLPALGRGHMTFGSFQRPIKISRQTLDLWSDVLGALPGSRLLLGAVDDAATRDRLVSHLHRRGVERRRIDILPSVPMAEYLEAHAQVDILLDTVPYPSGTTAHHGIWMGVPTLTRTGDTPVTWQCAGLLGAAGLDHFIVNNDEAFVQRAVHWSKNLEALGSLRQTLRDHVKRAPLLQPRSVAAGIEAALREMWRRWCLREPVRSFEVGGV